MQNRVVPPGQPEFLSTVPGVEAGQEWVAARVRAIRTLQDIHSAVTHEMNQQVRWLSGDISTDDYQRARRRVQIAASALLGDLAAEQEAFAKTVGPCPRCEMEPKRDDDELCDTCAQRRDEAQMDAGADDEGRFALLQGGF